MFRSDKEIILENNIISIPSYSMDSHNIYLQKQDASPSLNLIDSVYFHLSSKL